MINGRPESLTEGLRKAKAHRILRLIGIPIVTSVAGGFLLILIVAGLSTRFNLVYVGSSILTGLVFGLVPSLICAGLGYLSHQRYGVESGAFIGGILVGPVVAYLVISS